MFVRLLFFYRYLKMLKYFVHLFFTVISLTQNFRYVYIQRSTSVSNAHNHEFCSSFAFLVDEGLMGGVLAEIGYAEHYHAPKMLLVINL